MRRSYRAHRRLGLAAVGLVAAPLLVASAAYACTSLANLQANPGSGQAGATITVTGSNFRNTATSGPVEIRLDSRTGPVIASLATSEINPVGRTISVAVPISSDAALGFHTLLATQRDTSTGALLSGFPVRASYMVNGPAARESATAATGEQAVVVAPPTPASAVPAAAAAAGPAVLTTPDRSVPSAAVQAEPVVGTTERADPTANRSTGGPARPTASAASPSAAPLAGTAAPLVVAPVPVDAAPASPAVATSASPTLSTETSSTGLIPTAASASSRLPGFALLAGVAIVLLSLLASVKSGRSVLVYRRFGTLA